MKPILQYILFFFFSDRKYMPLLHRETAVPVKREVQFLVLTTFKIKSLATFHTKN